MTPEEEIRSDLKTIKEMIGLCQDPSIAIQLIISGTHYCIEENKNVISLLKKEKKTLKKLLKHQSKVLGDTDS